MDGVELTFEPDMLEFVVDKAIENKLGASGLRSIVETVMIDKMFETPSENLKKLTITREYAEEKLRNEYFDSSVEWLFRII